LSSTASSTSLSEASQVSIGGRSIKVLSIESLIEDKKAMGRDKDLVAIRMLETLMSRKRDR
jgi:predicted nucleotidyltransferase